MLENFRRAARARLSWSVLRRLSSRPIVAPPDVESHRDPGPNPSPGILRREDRSSQVPPIPGFPVTQASELRGRAIPRFIPIERARSHRGTLPVDPDGTAAPLGADGDGDGSETVILPGLDLPYPIPRSVLLLAARGELTLRAGINLLDAVAGDEREDREGKSK